jgi:putative transposase
MEKLQPNQTYHIFNHANGFENLYLEDENYRFFLEKYQLYILPIAETYAYCLLPNHFHLVVRIRRREVIEECYRTFSKVSNFGKDVVGKDIIGKDVVSKAANINDEEIERYISKQFANLFSCYTQSFNKVNKRRGSLFLKNFKRQLIDTRQYFESAVAYTHRNPIHHRFCRRFEDWSYTSYCEIKADKSQLVETSKLLKMYEGVDGFIASHTKALRLYERELLDDL